MKLHKEGLKTLRNEIIILIALNYLTQNYANDSISTFIFISSILILMTSIYFFRVPKRIFENKDGFVYSPCVGKIVVIEETTEKEYYKDKRIQVSIFMSPLNVHNNL